MATMNRINTFFFIRVVLGQANCTAEKWHFAMFTSRWTHSPTKLCGIIQIAMVLAACLKNIKFTSTACFLVLLSGNERTEYDKRDLIRWAYLKWFELSSNDEIKIVME